MKESGLWTGRHREGGQGGVHTFAVLSLDDTGKEQNRGCLAEEVQLWLDLCKSDKFTEVGGIGMCFLNLKLRHHMPGGYRHSLPSSDRTEHKPLFRVCEKPINIKRRAEGLYQTIMRVLGLTPEHSGDIGIFSLGSYVVVSKMPHRKIFGF